jgi:predicted extracellular nuclease
MLVQFGAGANHCATVVAPTNSYNEYYVVLSDTNISKVYHGDPESVLGQVMMVNDADSATVGRRDAVKTGDTVCGIVGPLTYNFADYKIDVQKGTAPAITPGPALDTPVGGGLNGNQFSLSTFNAENFFDTVDDPNTSDDVVTPAELVTKTTKLAVAIRDKLNMPVVLGMEEVENSAVLDALVARPELGGKYSYVWRDSVDPRGIDVALLYQPSRVTILDVKQYQCYTNNTNNDDLNNIYNCAAGDPPVVTGTTRLYPRQPLVVRLRVKPQSGAPLTMTVIVNHFRSQIASASSCPNSPGNNCMYYRLNESLYLNRYISNTLAASGETNIAVLGDFNEFTDSDTIQALKNGLLPNPGVNNGTPVAGGTPLHLLTTEVPHDRQYSYVFDGVHQTLDHILISNNLYGLFRSADYAHFDADYPFYKDASSHALADDSSLPNRVSDHDPAIVTFWNSYYGYLPLGLRTYQSGW